MGSGRRRLREWLVLGLGLVAGGSLVVVALAAIGDPTEMGRAEFARLSGSVFDGIIEEWGRWRQGEPAPGLDRPPRARIPQAARVDPESPRSLTIESPQLGDAAFGALLAEASGLDRQGRTTEALGLVLDALESTRPRITLRAEGRLRAIQLAVSAGANESARTQWQVTERELEGTEVRDGVSLLLISGLAASPALAQPERRRAARQLGELWLAGRLALPEGHDEASSARAWSLRRVLAERLSGMLSDDGDRLGEALREYEEAAAVTARVGGLAGSRLSRLVSGTWDVLPIGDDVVVARLQPGGGVFADIVGRSELLRRFAERVEAGRLLPDGFRLDVTGDRDELGPTVRLPCMLAEPDLEVVLRHADPDAAVRRLATRAGALRAGLIGLGIAIALAGWISARGLRRERRLGDLRTAFIAGVSHELRTPVSSILLLAENLHRGRVDDEQARGRYVVLIRREADRLRRLVDDVLDVSRLQRGEAPSLRLEEIDVRRWANDLVDEAKERAESAGKTFRGASLGLPATAELDSDAMRRAILNLIDNAVRHSGSDMISVELRGEPHGGFTIAVADRGRGIPRSARESVFRPFERGAEVRAAPPGAGLGLAIARAIVEAHGGVLEIRDPPLGGAGTVFEARLPMHRRGPESADPDELSDVTAGDDRSGRSRTEADRDVSPAGETLT